MTVPGARALVICTTWRGVAISGIFFRSFKPWCAESEIRSIVRGEIGRHASLLGLAITRAIVSASRLARRPISSAPLSSELLTQHTSDGDFPNVQSRETFQSDHERRTYPRRRRRQR